MNNENNLDKSESHDTDFYPLDTLESEAYSREYKTILKNASSRKRTGIVLLCCGIFLILAHILLLFLIMAFQCQNDAYGWCGVAAFVNTSPVAIVGIIMLIIGVIKTIRAKRILENKRSVKR